MDRVLLVLLVLAAAAAAAAWWRSRQGRAMPVTGPAPAPDLAALTGVTDRPAFVTFTAPGCAPCTRTRLVLEGVADNTGAALVSVDVSDAPGIARRHGVRRAPTTLVLDAGGRVTGRVSGIPDANAVAALVAQPVA